MDYTYDIRRDTAQEMQHPVLTHLARGAEVAATTEVSLPADGYHWQPIRWGTDTTYVARELLATAHVRSDPAGLGARDPRTGTRCTRDPLGRAHAGLDGNCPV